MRRHALFIFLLAIILIGVGITLGVYYGFYLREYREVPIDFKAEKGVIGFDVDKDALHMGAISPGNRGSRTMTITPAQNARLVIRFSGNASPYIIPERNNFRVYKDTPFGLNFTALLPENLTEGNYSGKVKFYFYRS